MTVQILFIIVSLVLLTMGAEFLVRGSGSLALRFGISPLVVGLTVVAFGTSAPELVVSMKAASLGQGDISAGNVIGSNIFNIAAILGLAACISPMRVQLQLIKFDAPVMVLVSLMLISVLWDKEVNRAEGIFLFLGIIAYTAFNVWASRNQHTKAIDDEYEEAVPNKTKSPWLDLLYIAGGLALLVLGSRILVENAVVLARGLGVSEAVIGLTIVSAGTSMPEMATSLVAAYKKESDIAIGNVVGSSIFNILCILGLSAAVFPIQTSGIQPFDLAVMLALTVVLVPMLVTGHKIVRWEGAVLLTSYFAYLAIMWPK